jgi:hypothetical protein
MPAIAFPLPFVRLAASLLVASAVLPSAAAVPTNGDRTAPLAPETALSWPALRVGASAA